MSNIDAILEGLVEQAAPDNMFNGKPEWNPVLNAFREVARKAVREAYELGYAHGHESHS